MHSSFTALRREMPMNVRRRVDDFQMSDEVRADVAAFVRDRLDVPCDRIAAAVVLLGQAVVAYEIFTGKADEFYLPPWVTKGYVIKLKDDKGKSRYDFEFDDKDIPVVQQGSLVSVGDPLFRGNVINKIFYVDMSRLLLTLVFILISVMVTIAYKKRKREGRI